MTEYDIFDEARKEVLDVMQVSTSSGVREQSATVSLACWIVAAFCCYFVPGHYNVDQPLKSAAKMYVQSAIQHNDTNVHLPKSLTCKGAFW